MNQANERLFEQWWSGVKDTLLSDTPEDYKELARSLWSDCASVTLARAVAMLYGEARDATKQGKDVAAQAIRYAATKVSEMEV